MMLADQGADVIKVEALDGDLVRGAGATRSGITSTFISSNRSKRALAIDLKTPEGVEALKKLLANSRRDGAELSPWCHRAHGFW